MYSVKSNDLLRSKNHRLIDMAIFLAGCLMPLAYAPYRIYPLALGLVSLFFISCLDARAKRVALRTWLFNFGMFVVGTHWVYHSMHVFGKVPIPVAVLLTVLLAAFLASIPCALMYLGARYLQASMLMRLLMVFPAIWTLAEWTRGWFLTGFPWLALGYSQTSSPLVGFAPVFGVYGVTFLTAVCSGLIALFIMLPRRQRHALAALLLIMASGAGLNQVEWSGALDRSLQVSLVQGAVAQENKWDPEQQSAIMQRYLELSRSYWRQDLVVWPETAIPAFYHRVDRQFLQPLATELSQQNAELLTGIVVEDLHTGQYYNSMVTVGGDGGVYHKQHLVPFGEYIPLRSMLNELLDILRLPMTDFSSGSPAQPLLRIQGLAVGISICYEIAFGEEIIQTLPEAAFLINVSNNAWFGDSSAPHQVLQMGQMRARETERYLLSATNDGVTAIVNAKGRVESSAPQFGEQVLSGTVVPRTGLTPYVKWGNYPIVIFTLLLVILSQYGRRRDLHS